jgi:hypothetical protein
MATKKNEITTTKGALTVEETVIETSDVKETAKEEVEVKEVIATPTVAEEKDKLVTVTSKIEGMRFVAGKWYNFHKDKDIQVTEYAKKCLRAADAIYI